jgi:hypothetical protein
MFLWSGFNFLQRSLTMSGASKMIKYKWDANTDSGIRVWLDKEVTFASKPIHIEDCCHGFIVQDWLCKSTEDASRVLQSLFSINASETETLLHRID